MDIYPFSLEPKDNSKLRVSPATKKTETSWSSPNKGGAAYFYSHSRHIMDKIKMPVSCPEIRRHKSLRNKSREEKAETEKKVIRAWVP